MSWDQPAFSFGSPKAQPPPTPTKTPTSANSPNPPFQTPKNNSSIFEDRSGWTPQFAEEYSVFFRTPGRLTSSAFADIGTPRERQLLSGEGDLEAEISTHAQHLSPNLNTPLPSVDCGLISSPDPYSTTHNRPDDSAQTNTTVTPRKPRRRLEEAFGSQTATPPASSKGQRKLAPKIQTNNMDQNYGSSEARTPFASTSADFFHPMSAPATAPAFTNSKHFWDPDTMDMDMDVNFPATGDGGLFDPNSHRISNSLDWGRDNQIFQDSVNLQSHPPSKPTPKTSTTGTATTSASTGKRQRPLAPKVTVPGIQQQQQTSLPPLDFTTSAVSEDPFSAVSLDGAVDPGLLFSGHSSISMPSGFEDVSLPPSRPATSHIPLEPYSHQLREASRDREELLRSRGSKESSKVRRYDRETVSSPVRGSARPSLQRSISDSRNRRTQDRIRPRVSRSSPTKNQKPPSLGSIPELPASRPRTEVKFTIDAKGRARTETVVIPEEPMMTQDGPSSKSEEFLSSTEESSDDEPIPIPSRNTSFTLPQAPKGPKLARFETSNRGRDTRRHSSSAHSQSESSSQLSLQWNGVESEAETEVGDVKESGNATQELKKVMEDRKKAQMMKSRNPQHHRYSSTASRGGSQYSFGSSTISPTTISDPNGATPSSTRSGTTRCVCNNPDSEGFMIQCESCDNWLHAECVGIDHRSLPPVYVCAFCANTPNMRGGRIRDATRGTAQIASSPLAHKSFKSFR